MEDLLQDAVLEHTRTDQETMDALYQIGVEGKKEKIAAEEVSEDSYSGSNR